MLRTSAFTETLPPPLSASVRIRLDPLPPSVRTSFMDDPKDAVVLAVVTLVVGQFNISATELSWIHTLHVLSEMDTSPALVLTRLSVGKSYTGHPHIPVGTWMLSSPHFLQTITITFTQMTLNFSSHFIHTTLTPVSPTSRQLCYRFLPGCLQIYLLLTLLRLNSPLMPSKSNLLKSKNHHWTPFTLQAILALVPFHKSFPSGLPFMDLNWTGLTAHLPFV